MCHFLKPLKLTQELSQKMSYSSELWFQKVGGTSAPPPFKDIETYY